MRLSGAPRAAALQGDWVLGAHEWRNPDEDLPTDFETRRAEHYDKFHKPLDPATFTAALRDEMRGQLTGIRAPTASAQSSWDGADAFRLLVDSWLEEVGQRSGGEHLVGSVEHVTAGRTGAGTRVLDPRSSYRQSARVATSVLRLWVMMVLVGLGLGSGVTVASRKAPRSENRAIRKVVMRICKQGNDHCRYNGARLSTRDLHFAEASATGENYGPEGILNRPRRRGAGWRWVIQQSGGPDSCENYRRMVPTRVLREFHIQGIEGPC